MSSFAAVADALASHLAAFGWALLFSARSRLEQPRQIFEDSQADESTEKNAISRPPSM